MQIEIPTDPQLLAELRAMQKQILALTQLVKELASGDVEKDYLSAAEVAERTGLSQSHIRLLFKDGFLKGIQRGEGQRILISKDSYEAHFGLKVYEPEVKKRKARVA